MPRPTPLKRAPRPEQKVVAKKVAGQQPVDTGRPVGGDRQKQATTGPQGRQVKADRSTPRKLDSPSRWRSLKHQYQLDRAIRQALAGPKDAPIDLDVVSDILVGLGDTSLNADDPFLTTLLNSACNAEGPVLQCGTSALTVLLAIAMQRRSQYLWSLDHNVSAVHTSRSLLARYGIRAGQVIHAPAEAFGDHIWYVLNPKHLPKAISLVVCDGSNVLPNGLRGVVRRLEARLSHRCVLLVRNTHRPKDLDFASKWAKSVNAPFVVNNKAEPSVKIALRDQTEQAELLADRVLTVFHKLSEPDDLLQAKGKLKP